MNQEKTTNRCMYSIVVFDSFFVEKIRGELQIQMKVPRFDLGQEVQSQLSLTLKGKRGYLNL